MDVGDPSNMERLLHSNPDVEAVRRAVSACSVSDAEIRARIVADHREFGRTWCPHSATAAQVHALLPEARRRSGPWVLVATAHPAKFAEIVEPLIGTPVPVPDSLAALLERPLRCTDIEATLPALRDFLRRPCLPH
jgi:threonine synthase